MKRARWIPVLIGAAGLLTSCGDGGAPPTTGSIVLLIQIAPTQAKVAAPDLSRTHEDGSADSSVRVKLSQQAVAGYTSARATATGPTNKSVDLTLNAGFWEGELTDLNVGTYSVTVEGLVDGQLAARGVTSGVTVTAGQQTPASVTVTSFVPTIALGIGSPTTSLEIPVTLSTVQGADGYRVEFSPNADFTGASSKDLTTTTGVVSVSALGTFNFRARAVSGGTAGAPGSPVSLDVAGDVPATGADAATALALGFGPAINQHLAQLNIVPANDEDWFKLDACRYDTVVVETFAARLTPASKLNTRLRVYGLDGTVLEAENDDLDGTTTDSRITTVLGGEGSYWVQVTGVGSTVGQYEIDLAVRKGSNDDGSTCRPITVAVTPATKTLAPGATQQYTAAATDATGGTVSGVHYLWVTGNANVAVVDTTGLVTAVGGGTTTVTAVGQGEPGNAEVIVTGPALGTPTQLAFSAAPATTTAGTAFSPAIEVEVQDANGNRLPGARTAVTLAIANNPGGATLYGTKTVNANDGVARFTGLYMDKVGSGYTLTASGTSLNGATSTSFAIDPGTPTQLTFGQQPTSTEGNVAIAPGITVTISDAFDNVVTSATNPVTVDFGVNVWRFVTGVGATLLGTKTVAAMNGVATFSTLRADLPGSGYTLLASAPGLTETASNPFAINLTVQSVRAGKMGYHSCALTSGGTYCWGFGGDGQLGDGTGTFTSTNVVPRLVSGGLVFTQVTTGGYHSCGLTAAGAAYCWGSNGNGQLGNNSTANTDAPVAVSGGITFSSISAGEYHTCGVAAAALYCWGSDGNGQLGDDANYADKLVPTLVAGGLSWLSVSPGYAHTCALTTGGSAYCWGYDGYGQLGDNAALTDQPTPVVVAGGKTWMSVNAAYSHTCGVDVAGAGFCWGTNYNGRLGADTTSYPRDVTQATPVPVFGGLVFSTIQTGWDHTCGLTTTGAAYCWGANSDGELGDGSTVQDSPIRVAVAGGLTFNALTVGGNHTCGRVGTAVWCWGGNWDGELGNGTVANKNQPVQIVQ
jgi:alpha-tubulin suppressor-like RCC1 family protein